MNGQVKVKLVLSHLQYLWVDQVTNVTIKYNRSVSSVHFFRYRLFTFKEPKKNGIVQQGSRELLRSKPSLTHHQEPRIFYQAFNNS